MGDFWQSVPRQYLLGIGIALVVFGVIQAAPHVLLSYQLGLALCGLEGSSMIYALRSAGHCWGCGIALVGLGQIGAVFIGPRPSPMVESA